MWTEMRYTSLAISEMFDTAHLGIVILRTF
jgi:hypothetical protein